MSRIEGYTRKYWTSCIKEGYKIRFTGDGIVIHKSCNVTLKKAQYHNLTTSSCFMVLGKILEIKSTHLNCCIATVVMFMLLTFGEQKQRPGNPQKCSYDAKSEVKYFIKFNNSENIASEHKRGFSLGMG